MKKKVCTMCGVEKPLSEYYSHPRTTLGVLGRCKVCHRSEARRVRHENIDRYRSYDIARGKLKHRMAARVERQRVKRREMGLEYRTAHKKTARAIASGKLIRPDHCARCKVDCFPQAHHDDYSKPLDVMWLCPICHAQRHLELGRLCTVDAPILAAHDRLVAESGESK